MRRTPTQIRNDKMFDMFEKFQRLTRVKEAGLDIYALSQDARAEIISQLFSPKKKVLVAFKHETSDGTGMND